jgi:hypothetical protein
MVLRSLLIWLVILLLAIINGAFRQAVLIPRMSDLAAHVASTLLLSVLVVIATWLMLPWVGPMSTGEAWGVGMLWLVLTVAFEFLAGHYLFGSSWEKLLLDYNITQGHIWPLALMVTLVAPVLVYLIRRS